MENLEVEHQHAWEQEEDDELEEGLIARRNHLNQPPLSTTINGDSFGVNNGKVDEEEEEVMKDFIQQNDNKVDEDEKEKEKQPEFCVYYDKDKGIWKCRICSWDNQGRTCLAHHHQHPRWHSRRLANVKTIYETKGIGKSHEPEKADITIISQQNGNGMHSVISEQNREHQKQEISCEGDKSAPSSYINNKTQITDIEVIKDGDDEVTEYDVETVLKKQDTHDLFCPNCNSCITKRVILRKRKRRIRVPEDGKRSKPQTQVSSDNQALNGVDSPLDDVQVQPPTFNEFDHQREPDVFRCLSCFSIFMPTGNGFKFLRVFGNKSNELSQNEVPVKKSWFSNIFRPEKVEHSVTDLNDSDAVQSSDAERNVGVSSVSSNLNSSMQEANTHISNGTTDLEKNQLQSDEVISKEKMATDSTSADTNTPLLTSYHIEKESDSKSEYPGMFVVKPPSNNNVEPEENSISPLQHDGLKLLVPPNVGSLIIDNSQMNQELDVTVQTNSPDVMPEVSQQVVQNNVEIHLEELEEPLKIDNDVLTDNQINLLENFNNIERIKGNHTIITIESKQLDAPVLQQAVEQGGVTTAARGGHSVEVIKSIVYGGLIELIASLSVVASAAGGDAGTLNVLAVGLANIFGGLFVISHDLWDLRNERVRKTEDRYQQLLGQRADFPLHMTISLLSYLVFGFLPPLVYGFSFRHSNDKDLKLLTVAAASIVCVVILAAGRAYVQSPRKSYFKTISYHVMLGFTVSGASYLFGGLIVKVLEKLDIFQEGSVENLRIHGASSNPALATF